MNSKSILPEIQNLKKELSAVILAHNYQLPEVQDIADFVGDSLELSIKAANINCKVIVFCGVHFMAETASILSPEKVVLLPDETAGCPLADMITVDKLLSLKQQHPSAVVVCYINSSAAIKSKSDFCCTSANALKIIKHLPEDKEIIFVPDKYLGDYVSKKSGRKMILGDGFCPTHRKILPEHIIMMKENYPYAKVMVHPECTSEVINLADEVLGTGGMCRFARESEAKEFIVGTEVGLIYRLKRENPQKNFYPATELAVCPNMKKINLEKILWSMQDFNFKVKVDHKISKSALVSIKQMLEVS